jgi:hypothetical protein
MERVPELYVTVFGALKHGAVIGPLFSAFGPDPVRDRLLDSGAKVLVTTPDSGNNTSDAVVISNREATTGGSALVIQQEEEEPGKYALRVQDYNAGTPVDKFIVDNMGTLSISGNIIPTSAFSVGTTSQTLVLAGSTITLDGTTRTNGVDLTVDADNTGGGAASQRIIFERGTTGSDVALRWNETADQFAFMTVGGADAMTVDLSGNMSLAGDVTAIGGFRNTFVLMTSNVLASQTDLAMDTVLLGNREYVLPYAGSIVGIGVASSEARTAGTLTVDATVNGTKSGLTAVLDGTNTQFHTATQAKDTDTFAAGNRLGVKFTTDGTWAPTTADIVVTVVIEY